MLMNRNVSLDQALYELQDGLSDSPQRDEAMRIVRGASVNMLPPTPNGDLDFIRLHTLDRVRNLLGGYTEDMQKIDDFLLWMSNRRESPIHTGHTEKGSAQVLMSPFVRAA